ncbi:MAG TPA: GIY-YIG nuclease family protein [Thermodesulfobacteriota bacterium]|nr:GIY-YIG nuclease family protein [Deltaproteobacteria bacterium]HNR11938.1 GIY-YIG nuclease family protein [Thermodesulfobacteriota bacterium]HNU71059.1 GIY-YIG nuclease family protein [Thermodesulfobacteriota bacterium]
MAPWYVYVIRTIDQALYAGIATNVERRFREHQAQGRKTARYLRAHKPASLELCQRIGSRSLALKVEHHFKRLPKSAKEQIVHTRRIHFNQHSGKILIS